MSDYISREAVLDLLSRAITMSTCLSVSECKAKMLQQEIDIDLVKSIPAADVRPVVRGKWSRIDYEPHGHDYKCSACGWKNDMPTHYCPNCGADMRGEAE